MNVYTRVQMVGVEPMSYCVVNKYCPGARWQAVLQQVMCRFCDSVFLIYCYFMPVMQLVICPPVV